MGDDPLTQARAAARRYLEHAARSERDLEVRLRRAGFDDAVVSQVVDECRSRRWVDDAALARAWVADRADRKGLGARRLEQELRRHGVDGEIIDSALAPVRPEDEVRRAAEALHRRLRGADPQGLGPAERARLHAWLARRGFAHDTISAALRGEDDDGG